MSPAETAAYNLGVKAMMDVARIAAITIETGPEAEELPKRGAVAALYGLAESASDLFLNPANQEN
jgi:hypothetical protein